MVDRVLKSNPLLESFGNAKTTRNNNSSRFGRYVLVRFSDSCEVVGAQVRTFLLERSRVTSTSKAKERSYHVMYELCAGKTAHTHGKPPDSFYYLSLSGQLDCPRHDDAEEFGNTSNALLSVGLSASELDEVWGFLAGMMYLGNIKFGSGDVSAIAETSPEPNLMLPRYIIPARKPHTSSSSEADRPTERSAFDVLPNSSASSCRGQSSWPESDR